MSICQHPSQCIQRNEDGEVVCTWCEELRPLHDQIKQLHGQLHKTAVIVYGGDVSIYGDIGYSVVYRGTITQRTPKVKLPSGD